ncbi:small vasohibin-binding protein-like [Sinocyclocheilus grahami]|uniref:small vasohibin-binding protein-like n=1 Tax=Sinocyclocheilus grahami TaxID=75366 RepID=UPI0007AC883E|nr:PREDICTED: small vasohibin-binding protein-like [Sinocyclocheilus grahami]
MRSAGIREEHTVKSSGQSSSYASDNNLPSQAHGTSRPTAFSLFRLAFRRLWFCQPACRKDKQKQQTPTRGDRTKQKSAQQELKQRQRAEIYALNKVMTELEQQQFEAFCKQKQSQAE